MTVEMQETLSLVSFILAGVFFAAAVVLFFVLKIPSVLGYLTGSQRNKGISRLKGKNLSQNNAESGNLKSDAVSGNLTITQKIGTSRLDDSGDRGATTVLAEESQNTTVLSQPQETTVLSDMGADPSAVSVRSEEFNDIPLQDSIFEKEVEINFTDSREIIE